jgi:steroid delta-isomerase-like uncharacterized protein
MSTQTIAIDHTATNRLVVRRTFERFLNGGELELAPQLYAPDVVYHASDGEELHGWAAIRELVVRYRRAFPDVVATVHDLIAEGDLVAARFTATGTHAGELRGIAPTGREVRMSGISMYRLRDGRIVEEWEGMCRLGMLEQIGANVRT